MNQENRLEKKLFRLQLFCVGLTLTVGSLLFMGFSSQGNNKFKEIDVERINIVENDGKLRMVISNEERQHGGTIDGKTFERKRPAGMLFFSEKGDEVGGLIFSGDNGKGQYNSLTFDKFRSDQTIALQHLENKDGEFFAGLSINDQNMPILDMLERLEKIKQIPDEAERNAAMEKSRKDGEMTVRRLAIGKGRDKSAFLDLRDAKGRSRIKLSVAADGNPKMDFLDENGKVIESFPTVKKD